MTNPADTLAREIAAAAPTREQQIAALAAKGLGECAETAVASIEAAMKTVADSAHALVADGNQLIEAIRVNSRGFQDQVASFTKLQENVALQIKQATNDVATFGTAQ